MNNHILKLSLLSQGRHTKRGIHLCPMWIQSHSLSCWKAALSGLTNPQVRELGTRHYGKETRVQRRCGSVKQLSCWVEGVQTRSTSLDSTPFLSGVFEHKTLNLGALRTLQVLRGSSGFSQELWPEKNEVSHYLQPLSISEAKVGYGCQDLANIWLGWKEWVLIFQFSQIFSKPSFFY